MNPHLCLIPGFDGTGKLFEPLSKEIGSRLDLTVTKHSASNSFEDVAREVESQLPRNQDIFLFGESYGGLIAIEIMSRNNLNISGAILCATFAETPYGALVGLSKYLPEVMFSLDMIRKIALDIFGMDTAMNKLTREEVYEVMRGETGSSIRKKMNILSTVSLYSKAQRITEPVLYLRGFERSDSFERTRR